MALPICYEAYVRAVFVIIKLLIDNWFYTLGFLVFVMLTKKKGWVQGLAGWAADALADISLLSFANIFAFLFTFTLTMAVRVALSAIVGIIWVLMVIFGKANIFLSLLAAPVVFFAGFAWGMLPFTGFLPFSMIIPYLFDERKKANIICIILIAAGIGLAFIFNELACNWINGLLLQLQNFG
ncbi:MAG: hypothetical protein V1906_00955 [Candidatus Woesearchaeota archaeon]